MPEQKRSALSDYMQNYGSKLQSMLHSPVNGAPATQADPVAGPSALAAPAGPTPSARPAMPAGPAAGVPSASGESQAGASFAQMWEKTPQPDRKRFADDLDSSLKKGNQTIDSAYNEMIQQLGTRPSGKLSREDKGALLMEFGLSLMANSARGKYGADLGGAVGASGLQTLGRYQQLTKGRQATYDAQVGGINASRAKAKSALAEKGAVEGIKGESELAKTELTESLRANDIDGTITSEGGDVYGYTKRGRASALRDAETGKPIKERQRPLGGEPLVPVLEEDGTETWLTRSEAAGRKKRPPGSSTSALSGLKSSDSNTLYRQAAGLFGGFYDPISGRISGLSREQTQMVQEIAARGGDIYLKQPAGSKNHSSAVKQAFEEVRSGEGTEPPETSSARDAASKPVFESEADVGAALERGEIQRGMIVTVNGEPFRLE